VDEETIHAVLSHADHTGVERENRMELALYACDEITGLITAVALVRPSKSILDVEVSSIKKKWKDKSFAAGTHRDEMLAAFENFGVETWEHVGNVLTGMKGIATDLGLVGETA
jgi:predicted hydrolase (HD superfamily)